MINKLRGRVEEIFATSISFEVNDIFYEIFIPSSLLEVLRVQVRENPELTLYVLHYIEGGIGTTSMIPRLIGFLSSTDREFFEKYTTVKGLGIRTALRSLTHSIKKIATAIERNDIQFLNRLPGLGKRTAEKIVAELRGKMARYALAKEPDRGPAAVDTPPPADIYEEAEIVLTQLGYTKSESERLIKKALAAGLEFATTEEMIQEIFKQQN